MKKLTTKDVTPGVKSAVNAYLMARVYAETIREEVDEVYKETLGIFPLYTDAFTRHNQKVERILDVNRMYLSKDEETCKNVYTDANFQLRKRGIKPDVMSDDECPALVAENIQLKTQWLICDTAAEMMGLDFDGKELNHRLLCMGLEKYKEFIDLIVGLVVNLPGFKNPLKA